MPYEPRERGVLTYAKRCSRERNQRLKANEPFKYLRALIHRGV